MSEEEIVKYIKFEGKYTKEVKKRLNKLIKKYHPDINKKDKETIIKLYKIKKELEEDPSKIKLSTINTKKSQTKIHKKSNKNVKEYLEKIINILKLQIKSLEKTIEIIYKEEYYWENKNYHDSYNNEYINLEIEDLKQIIKELKKHDLIELLFLIFSILIVLTTFITKNYLFFFLIILPIGLELIYLDLKKYKIKIICRKLFELKQKNKQLENNKKSYEININSLKEREQKLIKEKHKLQNDLTYYNYELSKLNSKENSYEDVKNNTK